MTPRLRTLLLVTALGLVSSLSVGAAGPGPGVGNRPPPGRPAAPPGEEAEGPADPAPGGGAELAPPPRFGRGMPPPADYAPPGRGRARPPFAGEGTRPPPPGGESADATQPPEPGAAPKSAEEPGAASKPPMATSAAGGGLPAVEDLTATRARPLFVPGRRGPEPKRAPPVVSEPVVVAPVETPPPPLTAVLSGVVSGPGVDMAILTEPGGTTPTRVQKGEEHEGWTLVELDRTSATFQRGDETTVLELKAPGVGAAPEGVATAAPVPRPEFRRPATPQRPPQRRQPRRVPTPDHR